MQRTIFVALSALTLFGLVMLNVKVNTAHGAGPTYPPIQPSPRPTVQQPGGPVPGTGGVAGGFADAAIAETVEPQKVRVGDLVEFNLTIRNWGNGYADNVVVTSWLPEALDLVEVKASRGQVKNSGNTTTIDVGAMASNEVIVVKVQGRVSQRTHAAMLTKKASVAAANDREPSNNQTNVQFEVMDAADMPPMELPVTGQSSPRVLYSVQGGDSLSKLASKFGVSIEALKAANALKSDVLVLNQVLIVPPTANQQTSSTAIQSTAYTVRDGENLFRISLRFGVPWETIARANHIVNPMLLQNGQKLVIPAGNLIPTHRTYTVRPGDTLTVIALKQRTTIRALKLANNLRTDFIFTGQVLRLP